MYNPPHFAVSDVAWMHAFIRKNAFATFAAVIDGAVHFAYVPVVLNEEPAPLGAVHFHVARANPMAAIADGSMVKLSIMGAHAYVSPDWYETPDQVPTWNYTAVEGAGRPRRIDQAETATYLARLAAEQEGHLSPKLPWSPAKLSPARLQRLLPGIVGFVLPFDSLDGKAKLSQNRSQKDIVGVIAALEERGDETGRAVASTMRKWPLG